MNTPPSASSSLDTDPLAGLTMHGSAIVDLAFGSLSKSKMGASSNRHLGLLPPEALDLDLTDPSQRHFGDYELLEQIGAGGMSVVYRANQLSLDREVAIKLHAAGPWASEEFIKRFHREAQNAARMQHPNIVAIYEVGSTDELQFFSMGLIRGPSLAAIIKQEKRLPPQRAAMLLRTIAEAVDYAHRLGVLHLDLKPSNVLLDGHGNPHVADFGLARRLGNTLAADNDEISGTPSYMAPEQARVHSQKITPGTDIWALGAILYELVTGQPPFLAESPQATLNLVIKGTVRRPRRYTPQLPRDLQAIILKCMARNALKRYPTAGALAYDLTRFIEGREVLARPLTVPQRGWRWMHREPKLAAVALLALGALLIGLVATSQQWRRAEHNADDLRQTVWNERLDSVDRHYHDNDNLAALPTLMTNLIEEEDAGARTDAAAERLRIGVLLGQSPRLIDRIASGDAALSVVLNRSGSHLAVAGWHGSIRMIDVASGRELWRTSTGANETPVRALRYTTDEHYLIGNYHWPLEVANPGSGNQSMLDAASGKPVMPPPAALPGTLERNYSADGEFALLRTDRKAQLFRVRDWAPQGSPFPYHYDMIHVWLLGRHGDYALRSDTGMRGFSVIDPRTGVTRRTLRFKRDIGAWSESPDGHWVAFGQVDGRVQLLDTTSGELEPLDPVASAGVRVLRFSDDGRWLGAGSGPWPDVGSPYVASDYPGSTQIWRMTDRQLIVAPIHQAGPVFALELDPVSRLIMTTALGDDRVRLWRLPEDERAEAHASALTDGPRHTAEIDRGGAAAMDPAHRLLASAAADGELRLWRLPAPLLRQTRAPLQQTSELRFDGEHLLAVEGTHVRVLVALTEAPLSPWFTHPQAVGFAVLAGDGHTLVTSSGRRLYVRDWRVGRARYAAIELPGTPRLLTLSSDARRLLVVIPDRDGGRYRDRLAVYALDDGHQLAARSVSGPLNGVRLDHDGHRVLVWDAGSAAQLLDASTLTELATLVPPGQKVQIIDSEFGGSANRLYTTSSSGAADGNPMLCQWNVPGRSPACQVLGNTGALALDADGGALATLDGIYDTRTTPQLIARSDADPDRNPLALALSPDGRMLAYASRQGLLLADARSGRALAPELRVALPAWDTITQLAFAPDGGALLARTQSAHWLYLSIAADEDTLPVLQREVAALIAVPDKGAGAPPLLAMPLPAADRATLRAHDPGPPSPPTPLVANATMPVRRVEGGTIPPRSPAAGPAQVDLTAYYNHSLDGIGLPSQHDLSELAELPPGLQRIQSVDFDIRGVLELAAHPFTDVGNATSSVHGIRTRLTRVAALDVLMTPLDYPLMASTNDEFQVTLHYRDGSQARVPIAWRRDIQVAWHPDNPAQERHLAWPFNRARSDMPGGNPPGLYRVVLKNPHPDRDLIALDIDAIGWTLNWDAFIAITLQPVATSTPANPTPTSG